MSSTTTPVDTAENADGRRDSRRRGRVLRIIGNTCLTAAFILAAYIAWLLWGTGIYTARQQDTLRQELVRDIASTERDPRPPPPTILPGHAYAILRIPSIEVNVVVVEGTDVASLKKGPGHYHRTNDPWERRGRVAIAGHRTTYGAPFWDLDKVRPGDEISLVTEAGAYEYEVTQSREVPPTSLDVLRSTPQPSLVLTTCAPKFSAARRLIVLADLVTG